MRRSRLRKTDEGSGIIEFSLAIATILIVLLGIVDLGRALYAYNWVSDSSRRATRYAMVRGTKCTGLTSACPATATDITTYVKSFATGIDRSQVTVTTQCYGASVAT